MSRSEISIPEAFFRLCNGFNEETIGLGIEAMARDAVANYLLPQDRPACREFIAEVLDRIKDDEKLAWLLKNCEAYVWMSNSKGARLILQQTLNILDSWPPA